MYILFVGDWYYPSGGWDDCVIVKDSFEDAEKYLYDENLYGDWAQIAHIEDGIVATYKNDWTDKDSGWIKD